MAANVGEFSYTRFGEFKAATHIANCGDQRHCGNRTDPLDLADTLAHLIGTIEAFDPLIVGSGPIN